MSDSKELRVKITAEEYAKIKTKAQLNGFNTLSGYVRERLLKINFQTKKRLTEIYETLLKRSI